MLCYRIRDFVKLFLKMKPQILNKQTKIYEVASGRKKIFCGRNE